MNRVIALSLLALPLLAVSCAHNMPYRPATHNEQLEYHRSLIDLYPDDVRRNLDQYTNTVVAWSGVIHDTEAHEGTNGMFVATTTIEHKYYEWEVDHSAGGEKINLSLRGEGTFRIEWPVHRREAKATSADAEEYAGPGKMIIVYGIPDGIEDNTIILKYHFLRVLDKDHFTMTQYDYGRFGQPVHYIGPKLDKTSKKK